MSITKKKYPLWSIWYEDEGYDINGERIMGRQAAGWSFLSAVSKSHVCILADCQKSSGPLRWTSVSF